MLSIRIIRIRISDLRALSICVSIGQFENEIGFFQEFLLNTISFVHSIKDSTDLAGEIN